MKTHKLLLMLLIVMCALVIAGIGCSQTAEPTTALTEITLPAPKTTGTISVEKALATRRSVRQWEKKDLTLEQISQIAWAGQGITDAKTGHRTAPSAMAMYPLMIYLFTKDGVFRYVPQGHKLKQVFKEDKRPDIAQAAMGQPQVKNAAMVVAITANPARMGTRGAVNADRWIYIEAGHVGENIHLQAVAMGLGSVTVGAASPTEIAKILALPEGETGVYLIPVGYPAAPPPTNPR